jgi:hypothetical protein
MTRPRGLWSQFSQHFRPDSQTFVSQLVCEQPQLVQSPLTSVVLLIGALFDSASVSADLDDSEGPGGG